MEEKIEALSRACESLSDPIAAATGDAALLNGPQLGGEACSQSDIDRLFDSFGKDA